MNIDLSGKRAVVCGSTQGIGRATAIELASLGAEVVLVARDAAKLAVVRAELPTPKGQHHSFVAADFGDTSHVDRAAAQIAEGKGSWDGLVLVNNSGGPPAGSVLGAKTLEFEVAFRSHVLASQAMAQRLVPCMKEAGYGRIINVISTSVKAPIPGLGVSNTIRGAMASWAKTLAGEIGAFGITVNNVLPGFTTTERLAALIKGKAAKANASEDAVSKEMLATIPLGRFAAPSEIAGVIAFLASHAGGYISGINVPVDGGRLPSL